MKDIKKDWRKKAREYLAKAFGGKCTICGYDRTITALDYHHIDPKEKDSQLSTAMRNGYAWSKIIEEARKCTLLCCRCHRELHAGLIELPKDYAKFNEEYSDVIKLTTKEFDACPVCGKPKNKRLKFCSPHCSQTHQQIFDVSKEDLAKLVLTTPMMKLGKKFGVSDNAVRKRCKKLGVAIPKFSRGYWLKANNGPVD